jgi:hypothetical protein
MDNLCLQIQGERLPHAYTLAARSQPERDLWVMALRKMHSAQLAAGEGATVLECGLGEFTAEGEGEGGQKE